MQSQTRRRPFMQQGLIIFKKEIYFVYSTALLNHKRTVFEEMSSCTALSWHIGMKTEFYTKNMKANIFGRLL